MKKSIKVLHLLSGRREACLIVVLSVMISFGARGQYSIVGSTCALPGVSMPYNISGGFSTADKWCITGGVFFGTSNSCIAGDGTPTASVTWNNYAGTGTLSYYHPSTAATPVATLTVTVQDGGTVSPGAVFVPNGVPYTINLIGAAPTQN